MATTRRLCARCKNPLSKKRLANRKKYCYSCEVATKRESKQKAHDRRVVATYGLRPGDYQKLYEAQDGRCAVLNCRATGKTKRLSVEHDHKCDKGHDPKMGCRYCVRGLTCAEHNGWIGKAGDDPEVFESIAEYLRNPPARKVLQPDDYDYTEGGMW